MLLDFLELDLRLHFILISHNLPLITTQKKHFSNHLFRSLKDLKLIANNLTTKIM